MTRQHVITCGLLALLGGLSAVAVVERTWWPGLAVVAVTAVAARVAAYLRWRRRRILPDQPATGDFG